MFSFLMSPLPYSRSSLAYLLAFLVLPSTSSSIAILSMLFSTLRFTMYLDTYLNILWSQLVLPLVPKFPQHTAMQASHTHSKPFLFPLAECYGVLSRSPVPSTYSKHKTANSTPPPNEITSPRQRRLSTVSRLSSPTSNLRGTTTTPLTHVWHLKLSPALLRFLSPEHLWWNYLSQHWHHIEHASTPLPQTPNGIFPLVA